MTPLTAAGQFRQVGVEGRFLHGGRGSCPICRQSGGIGHFAGPISFADSGLFQQRFQSGAVPVSTGKLEDSKGAV